MQENWHQEEEEEKDLSLQKEKKDDWHHQKQIHNSVPLPTAQSNVWPQGGSD